MGQVRQCAQEVRGSVGQDLLLNLAEERAACGWIDTILTDCSVKDAVSGEERRK